MRLYKLLLLLILTTALSAYGETSPAPVKEQPPAGNGATISGKVVIKGKTPMLYGVVLLYDQAKGPPPSNKYWRVPDVISGTNDDGSFSIQVPPGTYYLQAAQKKPDGDIGPFKENEYFYFHGDAKGNALPIRVTSGEYRLGVLLAFLKTTSMVQREKGVTSIEGVILDNEGNPVEDAVVFGYLTKEAKGRPTFISERSDKKGRYTLRVHDGGTFYLTVRSVYGGGRPQAGEFLNVTKEFTPVEVTLNKKQKLKGITLKVIKFSRPSGAAANAVGTPPPEKIWKNLGILQGQ